MNNREEKLEKLKKLENNIKNNISYIETKFSEIFHYYDAKLHKVSLSIADDYEAGLFNDFCLFEWNDFIDFVNKQNCFLEREARGISSSQFCIIPNYYEDLFESIMFNYDYDTKIDSVLFTIQVKKIDNIGKADIFESNDFYFSYIMKAMKEENENEIEFSMEDLDKTIEFYTVENEFFDEIFNNVLKCVKYLKDFKNNQIEIWEDYKQFVQNGLDEEIEKEKFVYTENYMFSIGDTNIFIKNKPTKNLYEIRHLVYDLVKNSSDINEILNKLKENGFECYGTSFKDCFDSDKIGCKKRIRMFPLDIN